MARTSCNSVPRLTGLESFRQNFLRFRQTEPVKIRQNFDRTFHGSQAWSPFDRTWVLLVFKLGEGPGTWSLSAGIRAAEQNLSKRGLGHRLVHPLPNPLHQ